MAKNRAAVEQYQNLASAYDRRWRHYVDCSVRRTLAALPFPPRSGDRALEVGCGTGAFLQKLAAAYPDLEIHGVDPTPAMLEIAREKCGGKPILHNGEAGSLPYPDAHFDLVASVSAWHYFPDSRKAAAEMARVLRPGGGIVLTDWCADFAAMRLFGALQKLRKQPLGAILRVRELGRHMRDAGVDIERMEHFRIRPLWGMMVLSGRRGQPAPESG